MRVLITKLDSYLTGLTLYALTVSLLTMLLLSFLTIVLRFFSLSYPWLDPLVRHLVFLAAFLGGVLATEKGVHISIDLVSKILETAKLTRLQFIQKIFTLIVTLIALGWLFLASYRFVQTEHSMGVIGIFSLPSSYLVAIIPVGVGLLFVKTVLVLLRETMTLSRES